MLVRHILEYLETVQLTAISSKKSLKEFLNDILAKLCEFSFSKKYLPLKFIIEIHLSAVVVVF